MLEVYHRDSFSLPDEWVRQCSVMITDPPYRDHVHANATSQSSRRGTRKRDLGFESLTRKARQSVARWASLVQRWSVLYSDVEHSNWLSLAVQARGVEYVRTIPWVRWSMPQLSGDRPPQGFEHVMLYHPKGRKRWNGPGNLTHLAHKALRGEDKHKSEKPLDQALDLVSFFSEPGETVFDPFAGSGTIGLACALLDRHYVGFELDEAWAARAADRLHHWDADEYISDRDLERVRRWSDQANEAADQTENAQRRLALREADKDRVRRAVGI